MILCLNTGNTNIFGGVFQNDNIILRFRHATSADYTSDQLGIFLKSILFENGIDPNKIEKIAICSVVPSTDYSMRSACIKYFKIDPFILQYGVKTNLQIKCEPPHEIGADRLANAIAAVNLYPNENIIIVSFGTATTFCAITRNKEYLGGAIMPGMRIAMESLQNNTAKLSAVEIAKPNFGIGRTTIDNIQSGLYYAQLGTIRELTKLFINEAFGDKCPIVIGTGGFAHLFQDSGTLHITDPDLILHGINFALKLNGN